MDSLIQTELIQERETRNMVVYIAHEQPEIMRKANIPQIYIRKTVLATAFGEFPARIKLTIERSGT